MSPAPSLSLLLLSITCVVHMCSSWRYSGRPNDTRDKKGMHTAYKDRVLPSSLESRFQSSILLLNFNGTAVCIGAVLDSEWVLTGAHCFLEHSNNLLEFVWETLEDSSYLHNEGKSTFRVGDVEFHFPNGSEGGAADIALVKVEPSAELGLIQSVQFSSRNYSLYGDDMDLVSFTSKNGSLKLEEQQIHILPDEDCNKAGVETINMTSASSHHECFQRAAFKLNGSSSVSCNTSADNDGLLFEHSPEGSIIFAGIRVKTDRCSPNGIYSYFPISQFGDWLQSKIEGLTLR